MSEYVEKKDKYTFAVSDSKNPVRLKVSCQHGTISSVSFYFNELITAECGDNKIIGNAQNLIDKTIEFNGSSGNPDGGQIKIIHEICEEGGGKLTYTFPDDYTGTTAFDEEDEEPSYVFYVKFNKP